MIGRKQRDSPKTTLLKYLVGVIFFLLVIFPVILYRTSSTPANLAFAHHLISMPPETASPTSPPTANPMSASPTFGPTDAAVTSEQNATSHTKANETTHDNVTSANTTSESPSEAPVAPKPPELIKLSSKVAFVITLVKNGKMAYLDAAVVLGRSIAVNFKASPYDLIALVHEDVSMDLYLLKRFGWKVKRVPTPVQLSEINNATSNGLLLNEIVKSGCCGELELVKFEAWKLTEYSKVILLDADVILTKLGALSSYMELLDSGVELIYNFDRGVGVKVQGKDYYNCVSAGFLMFKPSLEVYDLFLSTLKKGNWTAQGWENSQMGFCYGGATLQGLVAYYVYLNMKFGTTSESDNCRVNTIGNQVNNKGENCNEPWECAPPPDAMKEICQSVTKKWWHYRAQIEKELHLRPSSGCPSSAEGKTYRDLMKTLKPNG